MGVAPNSNVDRLSAVKLALASTREATEVDILVSTIQVLVHEAPRSRERLLEDVLACWPGTSLEASHAERAVQVAEELGVVAERTIAAEQHLLCPVGGDAGVAASISWTNQVLAETRAGIKDRVASEMMRELSEPETDWWMNALVEALAVGIREAFAAYQGDVSRPSKKWLIPSDYDRRAIRQAIADSSPNDAVARVLQALATEAIDPSVEFGTGIVTYLATGYILHAFLARRDLVASIESG